MKTLYTFLFSLFLTATSISSFAQNNSIQDFTIESDEITVQNNTANILSTITKNGSTLTWTQNQNGNTLVSNFSITNITGQWDSTISAGNIVLSISLEGSSEMITLTGDDNGISMVMSSTDTINSLGELSFNINNITYL